MSQRSDKLTCLAIVLAAGSVMLASWVLETEPPPGPPSVIHDPALKLDTSATAGLITTTAGLQSIGTFDLLPLRCPLMLRVFGREAVVSCPGQCLGHSIFLREGLLEITFRCTNCQEREGWRDGLCDGCWERRRSP